MTKSTRAEQLRVAAQAKRASAVAAARYDWGQPRVTQIRYNYVGGKRKATPTYISWCAMRQRCRNVDRDNYSYYGGRGIKVCAHWNRFENFLADMGTRPDDTELNRIDNDGDYEPGNVIWGPKSENIGDRNRIHGRGYGRSDEERAGQLRAYKSWSAMRDRCNNPNVSNYHYYGGRGIRICARWDKFDTFFADMGVRPVGAVLCRMNTDGDYTLSNCRWTTHKEQAANKRRPSKQ